MEVNVLKDGGCLFTVHHQISSQDKPVIIKMDLPRIDLLRSASGDTTHETDVQPADTFHQTDQIPSVRPLVDSQDKLWTEINVLDDVREMSNDARVTGSCFNKEYANSVAKLRKAQVELARVTAQCERKADSDEVRQVWE